MALSVQWQHKWQPLLAACLAVAGVVCIIALSSSLSQKDEALLQRTGTPYGYTYPQSGWTYGGKPIIPLSNSPYGSAYGQPATSQYGNAYGQYGNAYSQPEPAHRSGYVHPAGWADAVVDAHAEADKQRQDRFSIGGLTKRVMHPLESVGDEPHEDAELEQEPDHSEVERIWQGMEPLERAIEQMQKEITGQQSEITRLEGVIHDLKRDHPHAAAPPPPASGTGGEFSFSVPGTIEIGHLALPAGAYTIDLGNAAPAAAPAKEEEAASSSDDDEEDEEEEHAHAAHASTPSSTILDSRKEMSNGVDHAAVKQAAQNLQRKLVKELEEAKHAADARAGKEPKAEAKKRDDSVLDSAVDMHNGVNQAAVKRAADGFLEKMILGHETEEEREGEQKEAARAEQAEQADERVGEEGEARRMLQLDQHHLLAAQARLHALKRAHKEAQVGDAQGEAARDRRHVAEDKALLKELRARK